MNAEQYQKFIEWWQQNVKTAQDAKYGNAYFQQLIQKGEQDKLDGEAKDAQNTAALTSIGGAVAAPVLYGAGTKAAGMLGLGGAAAKTGATTAAQTALAGSGAGSTLAGTATPWAVNGVIPASASGASSVGGLGAVAGHDAAYAGAANAGGSTAGGGLMSLGGAVPIAGVGAGLALGAKGVKDLLSGKETKGWEGWGGRGTLGIATGGLSEVARLGGVGQKSTKDYEDERWGALSPELQGLRAANHDGGDGTWKDGKYAGEQWSFDKAQDLAKDDPNHFIGVLGNAETFGNDWLGLDQDKQGQVVSELLNQGLYSSNKGDVLINKDKQQQAKDIYASIIGGQ